MIHLSEPRLFGNELEYVTDALTSRQIAQGPYVERFEAAFADYVGMKYAVSCSSGTAGLHLALLSLSVCSGAGVYVPALSYVATANAVSYVGASPWFYDIDPKTWGCPKTVGCGLDYSGMERATIVTHLYGRISDVPPTDRPHVIEDACEALGAFRKGHKGKVAVYSFYGNKIITTGEGGMAVTNDPWIAKQLRFYRGQAQAPGERYYHTDVGYNYRMSNLTAALGLAQLETIDKHLERRHQVVDYYNYYLKGIKKIQFDSPWLYTFVLPNHVDRASVMETLQRKDIETRPTFVPLPRLPMYSRPRMDYPHAERLGNQGMSIPTHAGLTDAEVEYIVASVNEAVK